MLADSHLRAHCIRTCGERTTNVSRAFQNVNGSESGRANGHNSAECIRHNGNGAGNGPNKSLPIGTSIDLVLFPVDLF